MFNMHKFLGGILVTFILLSLAVNPTAAQDAAATPTITPTPQILTVDEMLQMVNAARQQIGHRPLVLDPILMSYIQAQADLAASDLPPQEGDTRENVIALGYGYPETIDTIFCTTSSAIKSLTDVPPDFGTPEERAVNNVYYRHIGFGISKGVGDWDGYIFYMLLACYGADNRYTPGPPGQPNPLLGTAAPASVSQVMIPVRTAAPQPNGQIIHEVLSGQTLWAIAVAYQTHIKDILSLNHLPLDAQMVYQGQKLLIPTPGNKVSISNPTQTTAKIFTPTHSTYSRTPVPSTDTPPFVHAQSTTTPTVSGEYESPSNNNILIIAIILAGCLVVVLISLFKK